MSDARYPSGDHVELRVPASSAYLAVLRTAAAGLAARLGFTLDGIEDLRIAVDEACAMVLPLATPDASLTCRFELQTDALMVEVSVPSEETKLPGRDTWAWKVLTALAGEAETSIANGQASVVLHKMRG